MNVLNQEIQAIEYQIAYYKKKKEKYEKLGNEFTVSYYEEKLKELEKELWIRLEEAKVL